jgi:sensor histidine kinase YesM
MVTKVLRPYLSHILTWAVFLFLPFIGYLYEPQKASEVNLYFVKTHFLNISFLAGAFYLNRYYIAPHYFFEKGRLKFIALLVLVLGTYIFISYLMVKLNPIDEIKQFEEKNILFVRVFIGPMIIYALCILSSTLMFLYEEQARQKDLNRLIELEKTATELNMLKLQISPHFLFNTLNNIRWLVRKKSEQSEESILKLAEILRYIIYEVQDTKVPIGKEIDHLKNYIELQSLRLPVEGNVVFNVEEGIHHFQIEPLLFIHFVENAFKYGIDSKNAPDIRFEFKKLPNGIVFGAKNKILLKKNTLQNEGIGLTNIQRRLELLYPNKHELVISKTETAFEVRLRLELD